MSAAPDIEPFRVLVETIDADGATVLVPIATNAVIVPDGLSGERVALEDGFIRFASLVLERGGERTRLLGGGAGEPYGPSPAPPQRWARVREDR